MTALTVAIRKRPLLEREEAIHKPDYNVEISNSTHISLQDPRGNRGIFNNKFYSRKFTFDVCFDQNDSQDQIFETVGKDVLESFMSKGRNSAVVAYGQTGSGKTYTMLGDTEHPGLIPKVCEALLQEEEQKYSISFCEIYNEKVHDLLVENCQNGKPSPKKLRVRQHPKQGPYVEGLSHRRLRSPEDIPLVLEIGCAARSTGPTATHHSSSRSHAIFTIQAISLGAKCATIGPRLHLVDLAGSEKPQNSATREQIKETAHINRSLATLGNVILALSAKHNLGFSSNVNKFVPYRDSTLTWLLRDSLGGSARTFMIGTISPSSSCYPETLKTLRYANRARNIFSFSVDEQGCHSDRSQLTIITALQAEISRLKQLLADATHSQDSQVRTCYCAINGSRTEEDEALYVLRPNISRPRSMTSPDSFTAMYRANLATLEKIGSLEKERIQSLEQLQSLTDDSERTNLRSKIEVIEQKLLQFAQNYSPERVASAAITANPAISELNEPSSSSQSTPAMETGLSLNYEQELDGNPFEIEPESDSSVWSEGGLDSSQAIRVTNDYLPVADDDCFSKSGSFISFDAIGEPPVDELQVEDFRMTQSYAGNAFFDNSGNVRNHAKLELNKSHPEANLRRRNLKLKFTTLADRLYPKKLADESRPKYAFLRRSQKTNTDNDNTSEPADPEIKRHAFRVKFDSLASSQATIYSIPSVSEEITSVSIARAFQRNTSERRSNSSTESSGQNSAFVPLSPVLKLPSIPSLDLDASAERRRSITATMEEISRGKLLKKEDFPESIQSLEESDSFQMSDEDERQFRMRSDSGFLASSLTAENFDDENESIPEEIENLASAIGQVKAISADSLLAGASDTHQSSESLTDEQLTLARDPWNEDITNLTTTMRSEIEAHRNSSHTTNIGETQITDSDSTTTSIISASVHNVDARASTEHIFYHSGLLAWSTKDQDAISITTITSEVGEPGDSPSKQAELIGRHQFSHLLTSDQESDDMSITTVTTGPSKYERSPSKEARKISQNSPTSTPSTQNANHTRNQTMSNNIQKSDDVSNTTVTTGSANYEGSPSKEAKRIGQNPPTDQLLDFGLQTSQQKANPTDTQSSSMAHESEATPVNNDEKISSCSSPSTPTSSSSRYTSSSSHSSTFPEVTYEISQDTIDTPGPSYKLETLAESDDNTADIEHDKTDPVSTSPTSSSSWGQEMTDIPTSQNVEVVKSQRKGSVSELSDSTSHFEDENNPSTEALDALEAQFLDQSGFSSNNDVAVQDSNEEPLCELVNVRPLDPDTSKEWKRFDDDDKASTSTDPFASASAPLEFTDLTKVKPAHPFSSTSSESPLSTPANNGRISQYEVPSFSDYTIATDDPFAMPSFASSQRPTIFRISSNSSSSTTSPRGVEVSGGANFGHENVKSQDPTDNQNATTAAHTLITEHDGNAMKTIDISTDDEDNLRLNALELQFVQEDEVSENTNFTLDSNTKELSIEPIYKPVHVEPLGPDGTLPGLIDFGQDTNSTENAHSNESVKTRETFKIEEHSEVLQYQEVRRTSVGQSDLIDIGFSASTDENQMNLNGQQDGEIQSRIQAWNTSATNNPIQDNAVAGMGIDYGFEVDKVEEIELVYNELPIENENHHVPQNLKFVSHHQPIEQQPSHSNAVYETTSSESSDDSGLEPIPLDGDLVSNTLCIRNIENPPENSNSESISQEVISQNSQEAPAGFDNIRNMFPRIIDQIAVPSVSAESDSAVVTKVEDDLTTSFQEKVTTELEVVSTKGIETTLTETTTTTMSTDSIFVVKTSHVPTDSSNGSHIAASETDSAQPYVKPLHDLYGMLVKCEDDETPSCDDEQVLKVSLVDGVPYITMQPRSETANNENFIAMQNSGMADNSNTTTDDIYAQNELRRTETLTESPTHQIRPPLRMALSLPDLPSTSSGTAEEQGSTKVLNFSPAQLNIASMLPQVDQRELRRSSSLESGDYAEIGDYMDMSDSRRGISWADLSGHSLEAGPSLPLKNESPLKPIIKRSPTNGPTNPLFETTQLSIDLLEGGPSTWKSNAMDVAAQTEIGFTNQLPLTVDSSSQYDAPSPTSSASLKTIQNYNARRLFQDLKMLVSERDKVLNNLCQLTPVLSHDVPTYSTNSQKHQKNFHQKLLKSRLELSLRINELWLRINDSSLEGLSEIEIDWFSAVGSPSELTLGLVKTFKPVTKKISPRPLTSSDTLVFEYHRKLAELRRALIGAYRDLNVNNMELSGFSSTTTGSSGYYSAASRHEMTASWVATNAGYDGPPPEKILEQCETMRKQLESGFVEESF